MKYALLITLLGCLITKSMAQKDSVAVVNSLNTVLSICQTKSPKDLAPYVVYRGDDKTRRNVDVCNYTNEEEIRDVDGIHHILKKLSPGSYTITGYDIQRKSDGRVLHAVFLIYKKESQQEEVIVAFLKVRDTYAIIDID